MHRPGDAPQDAADGARAPAATGTAGSDSADSDSGERQQDVQRAVERFVELHSCGAAPELAEFVAGYAEPLRAALLQQCREFLAFDGLLGHQEWEPQATAEQPGRPFGDFLIQEELGRGGMGIVYLAHQRSLNRRIALKVMASGLTLSKRHVERFRREAAAAARLRHPAIVAVHSLTEVDGTFALAMDYVAGRNLGDMLDDLRLANGQHETVTVDALGIAPGKGYVAECALLAAQIASALAAAHQGGVVHRDLKPRNLMLDDRRQARLLDFGLAKSLDGDGDSGSLSMSGEITGTAHYLSPEQTLAKRVPVDHRADIWALGVILYELLTLRRPFDGKNLQQIVYQICFQEPVPVQRRNPKVPRDLVTIVHKALEKDPQARYQSAEDFEADLQRFLRWEPVHAKPATAWTRLSKFLRRHRAETAIALTLLLVATLVVVFVWQRSAALARDADELLAEAAERADAGDFAAAISLTNRALELRNDEITRERLGRWHAENKRVETEALSKVAESKQLLGHDREGALLLALAAERQHPSPETRSAVLDALGGGSAARTVTTRSATGGAFSADGRLVVTTGEAGSLTLTPTAATGESRPLVGHSAEWPVIAAAFTADGSLLSTSPDRTLRRWHLDGERSPDVVELRGQARSLLPDRDGARVLIVTDTTRTGPFEAQVWDTGTLQPTAPPILHGALILTAALSPDGRFAATCSGQRNDIKLWRCDGGTVLAERTLATSGTVRALRFTPDGSLCAVATSDGSVHLLRAADGAPVGRLAHSRDVRCLAFDHAGRRLVTGSTDCTARVWQLEPGADGSVDAREVAVLLEHRGTVLCVAFDAQDQLVVTGTENPDGVLRVFDVGGRRPSSEPIRRYEVGASIAAVEFDRDSRRVLATAGGRNLIWDFQTARGVVTLRQTGAVPAACFVASGERLVTAGDDERLRLWATDEGRQLWATERLGNPMVALDVDPAGELIACGLVHGGVRVHRVRDGERLFTLDGDLDTARVVSFPAENRLLTAGSQRSERQRGRAVLWNSHDQSVVWALDRPAPIVAADLCPTAPLLCTVEAAADRVRLWSVPECAERGVIGDHEREIQQVRWSHDGALLVTASDDGSARIYRPDGQRVALLSTGTRLQHATFSPDDSLVLTCGTGRNAQAQLWRSADGGELLRFDGHRGTILWGCFRRDGAAIATAARDGTTCVWPTDPVAVAARLPLRAGSGDPADAVPAIPNGRSSRR